MHECMVVEPVRIRRMGVLLVDLISDFLIDGRGAARLDTVTEGEWEGRGVEESVVHLFDEEKYGVEELVLEGGRGIMNWEESNDVA